MCHVVVLCNLQFGIIVRHFTSNTAVCDSKTDFARGILLFTYIYIGTWLFQINVNRVLNTRVGRA